MVALIAADGRIVSYETEVSAVLLNATIQSLNTTTAVVVSTDDEDNTIEVWKVKKFCRNSRMLITRMTPEIVN